MERVWQKDDTNHAQATNDIASRIVGFYNSIRMHSKMGNLSSNALKALDEIKKTRQTDRNHLATAHRFGPRAEEIFENSGSAPI